MLNYGTLYINKDQGLKDAPDKLRDIHLDAYLRVILEALLLAGDVPSVVFLDLFNLEELELETYKEFFFKLPEGTSRMEKFSFIRRLENTYTDSISRERNMLFAEVFYNGWEFIDHKFNRGYNVSIPDFGKVMFKDMLMFLKRKTTDMIQADDIQGLGKVLTLVKEGTKLYRDSSEDSSNIQLQLDFVENIKKSSSANIEPLRIDGMTPKEFGMVDSTVDESLHKSIAEDLKKNDSKDKK